MTKREKTMKGFECCLKSESSDDCVECPYFNGKTDCVRQKNIDAFGLLKEQEKEIKALRKLLDWAMECDFGIDNLGDWWTERFAEEIEGMGYKESLIHLAKRYIEVFEGGDVDA